jgi:hypothetical protein
VSSIVAPHKGRDSEQAERTVTFPPRGTVGVTATTWRRTVARVAFGVVLLCIATVAVQHPSVNWDVLGYTAAVEAQHTQDCFAIHRAAYLEVRSHFSKQAYTMLTGETQGAIKSYADPAFFTEKISFYSIRPLYVLLLVFMGKFGFHPVVAARAISVASLMILGLVSYFWMERHVSVWSAFVLSSLLMIAYPVLLLGRLHTPDGMSAAVLLSCLFLMFELHSMFWALLLLLLSIYIRTDNVVLATLALGMLCVAKDARLRIRLSHGLILLLVSGSSVMAINYFAGNHGYGALFYNWFVNPVADPAQDVHIAAGQYFEALRTGIAGFQKSYALPFVLLGALAVCARVSPLRTLVWLALAAATLRFFMFPDYEDRFFTLSYMIFAIAGCIAFGAVSWPFGRAKSAEVL